MVDRPFNVLFLCTGNSARSIMAEAILNRMGAGRFHAFSAGSQPKGQVHSEALALLRSLGYETSAFRSKGWNEFGAPGATTWCVYSSTNTWRLLSTDHDVKRLRKLWPSSKGAPAGV